MKLTACIIARMASTRLPGKVLLPLTDRLMLEFLVERLRLSKTVDRLAICTTVDPSDDALATKAKGWGCDVVRGPVESPLERMLQAARETAATHLVRVTGDNPF